MTDHPDAPLGTDADARDALVDALAGALTGGLRARGLVGDWVGHALAVLGTRHLLGRRGRYTDLIVPAVGDVLVYQGHGQAIRDRIVDSLPDAGRVVLLGHSLGGVACVDLLATTDLPRVELLVTVGSQAPFSA
jgi:alpha-beta hydrolase superfamily lysophospholipase